MNLENGRSPYLKVSEILHVSEELNSMHKEAILSLTVALIHQINPLDIPERQVLHPHIVQVSLKIRVIRNNSC